MTAIHPLPLPLNRFVGREPEVSALLGRLEGGERLVTLTGCGGAGKTRLALEVARRVGDRAVAWVDLAGVEGGGDVLAATAAAVGVREGGGRSLLDGLRAALTARAVVLVLDNCEHVARAAASLARDVLTSCPAARVLATSREPLGVDGERLFPVPPLSLCASSGAEGAPDPGEPGLLADLRSEAVSLFVERAQAVLPSFRVDDANAAAVATICHRLDGLPLAIELAAARMRVLTPAQLAARLDDVLRVLGGARDGPPRSRTLRATMEWSYASLSEPERLLLERLAVFAGGFSLEAAEAVGPGGGLEGEDVLDLMVRLVERSLVTMRDRGGTARYGLLEVVRQFALERLRARGGEAPARRLHARWLAGLAAAHEEALVRSDLDVLSRLGPEVENVEAALAFLSSGAGEDEAGQESPAVALALAASAWPLWFLGGRRRRGRDLLEACLARAPLAPGRTRAAALHGAGVLGWWLGEPAASRAHLEEAVGLWRRLDEPPRLALSLGALSRPLQDLGDTDEALRLAREATGLAGADGDGWLRAWLDANGLGYVLSRRGDVEEADRVFAEAEGLVRSAEHPWLAGVARYGRAVGAWQRDDAPDAEAHASAAAELLRESGDPFMASRALLVVAFARGGRGEDEEAARTLGRADALRESVGALLLPMDQLRVEGLERLLRGRMGDARLAALRAVGRGGGGPAPDRSEAAVGPRAERAAAPLEIRALGPFEALVDGRPVGPDDFGSAKPRELLLFLLLAPEGRSREEVGRALWPGVDGARLRNSFHVTVHRLRKALGDADLVAHRGDRYGIAPDRAPVLDARRFEAEAGRALRRLAADPSDDEAHRSLASALSLYRGDFMEGELPGVWALEVRDRLKALYVEGARRLARGHGDRGRDREAMEAWTALLGRDDLFEEAYRELMVLHTRAGRPEEALRLYRQLETLLEDELDAGPEPETATLALSLGTTGPAGARRLSR